MYTNSIPDPPDLVRGSYTTDLNIFKIHEAILARFTFFQSIVPDIKREVEFLESK